MDVLTLFRVKSRGEDEAPLYTEMGRVEGVGNAELLANMKDFLATAHSGAPLTKTGDFEFSDGFGILYQLFD